MFCPECGTELAEGSHFCQNCGKKISVSSSIIHKTGLQQDTTIDKTIAYELIKDKYFKHLKIGLLFYVASAGLSLLYSLFIPEQKFYTMYTATSIAEILTLLFTSVGILAVGVVLNCICAFIAGKTFKSTCQQLNLPQTFSLSSTGDADFKRTARLLNIIASALFGGALLVLLVRYMAYL